MWARWGWSSWRSLASLMIELVSVPNKYLHSQNSIPQIGLGLRRFLPHIGPSYPVLRYLTPRIVAGKICSCDSEVHKNLHTYGVLHALWGQKKTKFGCGSATCQLYTHIIVYLGTIQGIHKLDLPIPWIEATCHSSSEVSSFDLYFHPDLALTLETFPIIPSMPWSDKNWESWISCSA